MPKKVCPNGHVYNSDVYGDECPICQQSASSNHTETQPEFGMPPFNVAEASSQDAVHSAGTPRTGVMGGASGGVDPVGETKLRDNGAGKKTTIRQVGGGATANGRKLVGFLVTYNRYPLGKSFNIYEGKNFIGRDPKCDISIPEDNQMSGQHMSILYRNVDNKFKFRDEQSSNGTFINKELIDEGELQNYDIIRLGSTVFIFIAIPKLG